MDLRKCYHILGLSETASDAQVKQRYRKLAKKYHPDTVTGDPHQFLKVKEAYEQIINHKNNKGNVRTSHYARSTNEYMQHAKERRREKERKEFLENERYFHRLISGRRWKFMRWTALVGTLLSLLIVMDEFLPYHYHMDRITAYEPSTINGLNYRVQNAQRIYTLSGQRYYVQTIPNLQTVDADVLLVKSMFFRNDLAYIPCYTPAGKLVDYTDKNNFFWIQFSFHAHSLLLTPFLLLPLLIVNFPRKTFAFTFFYFIALYLSAPLIYLYLLFDFRWLHLLSLGFL